MSNVGQKNNDLREGKQDSLEKQRDMVSEGHRLKDNEKKNTGEAESGDD